MPILNGNRPVNPSLSSNSKPAYIDIELFSGGGGMSVGLREAGFSPAIFYEANNACCETLRNNISAKSPTLVGQVVEGNTEAIDWTTLKGDVRLLAAGAPCQPFSLAGKHRAHEDKRNLFPEVLRAVRDTRPIAVLLENVWGITRSSFQSYFEYVLRQLRFPSVSNKDNESWRAHNERLKKVELVDSVEYQVVFRLIDAADFGVPQNRLRVFVVAMRADFPCYAFPDKTHSREALEAALDGRDYWDRHGLSRPKGDLKVQKLFPENELLPWVTVRDAISDLPRPARTEKKAVMNHWTIPGARSYHGHTGSRMDWTAKTIKAGVHGVPGGENTVVDHRGHVRYFTLRETARLQTFPDTHIFSGTRTQITRQIGNAVPSRLAAIVASPIYKLIEKGLRSAKRDKMVSPELVNCRRPLTT